MIIQEILIPDTSKSILLLINAPVTRVMALTICNRIVLGHDERDVANKIGRVSRGDTNGFYKLDYKGKLTMLGRVSELDFLSNALSSINADAIFNNQVSISTAIKLWLFDNCPAIVRSNEELSNIVIVIRDDE